MNQQQSQTATQVFLCGMLVSMLLLGLMLAYSPVVAQSSVSLIIGALMYILSLLQCHTNYGKYLPSTLLLLSVPFIIFGINSLAETWKSSPMIINFIYNSRFSYLIILNLIAALLCFIAWYKCKSSASVFGILASLYGSCMLMITPNPYRLQLAITECIVFALGIGVSHHIEKRSKSIALGVKMFCAIGLAYNLLVLITAVVEKISF